VIEIAGAIALVIICLLPFGLLLGVAMLGGALTPRAKLKVETFLLVSWAVIAPCVAAVVVADAAAAGNWRGAIGYLGIAVVAVVVGMTGARKKLKALKAIEGETA
jgi:hypothetical protein